MGIYKWVNAENLLHLQPCACDTNVATCVLCTSHVSTIYDARGVIHL